MSIGSSSPLNAPRLLERVQEKVPYADDLTVAALWNGVLSLHLMPYFAATLAAPAAGAWITAQSLHPIAGGFLGIKTFYVASHYLVQKEASLTKQYMRENPSTKMPSPKDREIAPLSLEQMRQVPAEKPLEPSAYKNSSYTSPLEGAAVGVATFLVSLKPHNFLTSPILVESEEQGWKGLMQQISYRSATLKQIPRALFFGSVSAFGYGFASKLFERSRYPH